MEENRNDILQAWDYKPYGFINTVVSEVYKDIPMDYPFPSPYIPEIYKYVTTDYFLNSGLPSVYTYFTVVKNNGAPVGIFAKCAKKNNAVSVCRYTQAAGWAWSEGELYRDAFDSILRFGFYSEAETDVLAAGDTTVAFGKGGDSAPVAPDFKIHPSALRALVYAAFLRWQRSDPLIRIGVPANIKGEAYNAYVLSAVRTLYSYFPVGLRVKAGFSSYLPAGKEKNLPYLYFGFVPQEEADSNTLFLDGSSLAVYEKLPKSMGRKPLDYFINSLLEMEDPRDRQIFIEKVFTDVDGRNKILNLAPAKYVYISDTLLLLNHEKSAADMMPEWIRFCNAPDQYPSSLVPDLYAAIKRELTEHIFSDYLDVEYPNSLSLQAFGEKYKQITNLCCTSSVLRECFWNRLDALLVHNGASISEVLNFLIREEKGLKRIGLARYQQSMDFWKKRLADQVKKDALSAMDAYPGSYSQRRLHNGQTLKRAAADLKQAFSEEEYAPILKEIASHGSELVVKGIRASFLPITRRSTDNSQEIKAAIADSEILLRNLDTENGPTADEARKEINDFIREKRQSLGERDVIKNRVLTELSQTDDYFAAIEHISAVLAENVCFEEPDKAEFLAAIQTMKPRQEKAYREAFQARYETALTFENLTRQDPLVVSCVLKDLSSFFAVPYRLSSANSSARKLRDRIVRRQAVVQQFQGSTALTIDLDGRRLNADLLKAILSCDTSYVFRPDDPMEEVALSLVEAGVYSGSEMGAVFQMFIQNDRKFRSLLERMFSGCFQGASEEEYTHAIESVYNALRSQGRKAEAVLDSIAGARDSQNPPDPTAKSAFARFSKKVQPAKSRVHPTVISTIVLGVLTLALIVSTVILALTSSDRGQIIEDLHDDYSSSSNEFQKQIRTQEQTIRELEEQLGRPVDLKFVEGQFPDYAMAIEEIAKLAEDDSLYQIYNQRYLRLSTDYVVAQINGTDITWGEYFFWECYFVTCDQQPVDAATFDREDIQAQVNAALVLTHTHLQAPYTTEEDLPPEDSTLEASSPEEPSLEEDPSIESEETAPEAQDLTADCSGIVDLVRRNYEMQMHFNHQASVYFQPLPTESAETEPAETEAAELSDENLSSIFAPAETTPAGTEAAALQPEETSPTNATEAPGAVG